MRRTLSSVWNRHRGWIIIGLLVLAAVIYTLIDPGKEVWMPKCAFRYLTGLDCPGCGSQRMLHSLLHGDLRGAWHANALLLCSLPLLLFMLWADTQRLKRPKLYARIFSPAMIVVCAAAMSLWTIWRNI